MSTVKIHVVNDTNDTGCTIELIMDISPSVSELEFQWAVDKKKLLITDRTNQIQLTVLGVVCINEELISSVLTTPMVGHPN